MPSFLIKSAAKGVVEVGSILNVPQGKVVHEVQLLAPGASSVSPNTKSVFVGPDSTAEFELIPGAAVTFKEVDPSKIQVDGRGTSGLIVMLAWGGPLPVATAPLV